MRQHAGQDECRFTYKVKAAGRTLVGVGGRRGTNQHWVRSCHEFKFYKALLSPTILPPSSAASPVPTEEPAQAQPSPPLPDLPLASEQVDSCGGLPAPAGDSAQASADVREFRALLDVVENGAAQRSAARDLVTKAISRLAQNRGEAWIQKARLRPFIQRMDSTFNESNFGFGTFNEMLASMSGLVDVRRGEFDHELRLRQPTLAAVEVRQGLIASRCVWMPTLGGNSFLHVAVTRGAPSRIQTGQSCHRFRRQTRRSSSEVMNDLRRAAEIAARVRRFSGRRCLF